MPVCRNSSRLTLSTIIEPSQRTEIPIPGILSGMVEDGDTARKNPLGETAQLLGRVREGDENAVRDLVDIYRPLLERWATGRIPGHARGLVDTVDVVQVCLVRVLDHVDQFDATRPGGFLAYLRRSLINQIRNEIRSAGARPQASEDVHEQELSSPTPGGMISSDTVDAYEKALDGLGEDEQAAVILRVEFGLKYPEIAEVLKRPSANAVRMQVSRALVKLAETMES